MRRIGILVVVFSFVSVCWANHADIQINYTSGNCMVDILGNGEWEVATVYMILSGNSIVKTGSDGKMELDLDGEQIAIGGHTTLSINSIVHNMNARGEMSWFQKVSDLFDTMVSGREDESEMVVLGIRGQFKDEEEINWMGDLEEEEMLSQIETGKKHYKQGDFAEAITIFKELIYREESSEQRGEIAYYLGSSLFHSVQYAEALPHLRESIRDKSVYYREAALIQYSFSCYFTGQYERAIDGYITYTEEFVDGNLLPYALLMLGKSYKAIGNNESAQVYFEKIIDTYHGTDVYMDALLSM